MKNIDNFNLDIKQLRSFIVVLSENSFTRASRKLKMGQATISHHIQQIEEALGVKLIIRSSKRFSITREGLIVKDFCENLFNTIEQLQLDISREVISGKTKIAASTIPSAYIIPGIIRNLNSAHPDFTYSTLVMDSREVIELIKEGTLEIGVLGKSIKHPQLEFKKVYSDSIVLVSGINAPDSITSEQLKSLPVIFRENGSGTRTAVENMLAKKKVYPSELNIVYECSTTEGIKEAVVKGLGYAFISQLAIQKELKLNVLKIIRVPDLSIERDIFVCHTRKKKLTRAAQLFYDELLKLNP